MTISSICECFQQNYVFVSLSSGFSLHKELHHREHDDFVIAQGRGAKVISSNVHVIGCIQK